MSKHECERMRARLPLWVEKGDRAGLADADSNSSDLTKRERREVEQHLLECASCREYRVALEQALGVLSVAASHLPVPPGAPSLWPLLEGADCESRQTYSNALAENVSSVHIPIDSNLGGPRWRPATPSSLVP